jgi:uncharacterized protein (DUF2141 family)
MKKRKVAHYKIMSALFIFIVACAKISNPSGGPRDRTPPVVLNTVPQYGVKNFRGKSVTITFDEYVTLDNINDKFMVSPPMKKRPKVYTRNKSVIADFLENLRDSTTYTLYFQDAIKDLNEGNVLEDYQFVLSTGPVIDSLSVTGNVFNATDLETPEKTMVLLYRELADSFVVKHLPDYISRVDQKGYFRINNIKEGVYRLYALQDVDNSKNYNLPDEEFAFMNSPIEVTLEKNYIKPVRDTVPKKKEVPKAKDVSRTRDLKVQDTIVPIGEYPLMLFAAARKAHYLTSSGRPNKFQLIYTLSLPPDTLGFRLTIPDSRKESYYIETNPEKDTIKVWLTDSTLYSQTQIKTIIDYPFTDSLGVLGFKEDTIQMRFMAPRPPRGKVKKPVFAFETNIKGSSLKPGQKIILTSLTPFRQPDTSRIRLYQVSDSAKSKTRINYSLIKDTANSCKYYMNADLKQDKKYLFVADSASFSNIYDVKSDSVGLSFSFRKPDSFSKLTFSVKNSKTNTIIQLLTNTEKLVSEAFLKSDGKVVFPMLDNGTYRARVIYDLNGDGKWTTGDFNKGRQPEPVSYYPNEIELKSGWEVEQDWDIGKQWFKPEKLKQKKTSKSTTRNK